MDSRHDFTLEKVFWGYFGALDQKANSALADARGHGPDLLCQEFSPLAGFEPLTRSSQEWFSYWEKPLG